MKRLLEEAMHIEWAERLRDVPAPTAKKNLFDGMMKDATTAQQSDVRAPSDDPAEVSGDTTG